MSLIKNNVLGPTLTHQDQREVRTEGIVHPDALDFTKMAALGRADATSNALNSLKKPLKKC